MMIALAARAAALNCLGPGRWTLTKPVLVRGMAVVACDRTRRRGQVRRHAFEEEGGLSFRAACAPPAGSAARKIGISYDGVFRIHGPRRAV
jgi:hypothetical protein